MVSRFAHVVLIKLNGLLAAVSVVTACISYEPTTELNAGLDNVRTFFDKVAFSYWTDRYFAILRILFMISSNIQLYFDMMEFQFSTSFWWEIISNLLEKIGSEYCNCMWRKVIESFWWQKMTTYGRWSLYDGRLDGVQVSVLNHHHHQHHQPVEVQCWT